MLCLDGMEPAELGITKVIQFSGIIGAAIIASNPWVEHTYPAGDCARDPDITGNKAGVCNSHLQ